MKKLLLIGSLIASLFAVEVGHYKCVYVGYIKNGIAYTYKENEIKKTVEIDVTKNSVSVGVDKYHLIKSNKKANFYMNTKANLIIILKERTNGFIPVLFLNDKNISLVSECLTDKDLKKYSK